MSDFEQVLARLYTDPDFQRLIQVQGVTALSGYNLTAQEIEAVMRMALEGALQLRMVIPTTDSGRCHSRS